MGRPAANKVFVVIATFALLGALAACSRPAPDEEDDGGGGPPGGLSGGLYMHSGTNGDQGLFELNLEDGAATKLGWGMTFHTGTTNVGLTGRGPNEPLLGSDRQSLFSVPASAAEPELVAAVCSAVGLAYDTANDHLYAASSDRVERVHPGSCEVLESISTGLEFGGLAIDSSNGTLYAIGASDGNLYALDLASGAPYTWAAVVDTGVTGWVGAGLAFDAANEVLYAVGHPTDRAGLYVIDVAAGTTEHVGDTGLWAAYGGLAWREED